MRRLKMPLSHDYSRLFEKKALTKKDNLKNPEQRLFYPEKEPI